MIQRMKLRECIALLLVLAVAAAIILPALSRSREASRRSSCANNLKQWGLVLKMYANESRGGRFPPLSNRPSDWFPDMRSIYPEYATDLSIAICPSSPLAHDNVFRLRSNFQHPQAQVGDLHPDCVAGRFYNYTGFWLSGDEPALALYWAYHANGGAGLPHQDLKLPIPRWSNSAWQPVGSGGVLLWDRIPPHPGDAPHDNLGANVLTMDGAVQFVKYSPLNSSRNFPVTELATLTYGADYARTSRDCL